MTSSLEWGDVSSGSTYQGFRLSIFQVRPFSPAGRHDGSQAILLDLLRHFDAIGVRTTLYCGQAPGLPEAYRAFPHVTVRPVLRFDPEGQSPYQVTPDRLLDVIDTVRYAARDCDAFYLHDCDLRFGILPEDRPVVSAVFDLIYGHTLVGALNFARGRLVAISDYVGDCLREMSRRVRPHTDESLHVVDTGFATDRFRPWPPQRMRDRLGLPADALAILYPHRAEAAKGILDALTTVRELRGRLSAADYARVRLAVPVWGTVDPATGTPLHDEEGRHAAALRHATELGVADKLHLHRWVPRSEMAEYYSAGTVTYCAGTFPEAFGNVHVESLLSGTPVVVSRVAAQRGTVGEELARKVDPGDTATAADQIAEIIQRGERTGAEARDHLRRRFGMARMLRGYERAVLDCAPGPPRPLAPMPEPATAATRLRIPPWAAALSRGYYHDYSGYCTDSQLLGCVSELVRGVTVGELAVAGRATTADVTRWVREGLVVADPPVAAGS